MFGATEILLLILVPLAIGASSDVEVTPSWRWHFDNFFEDIEKDLSYDFQCFCKKSIAEIELKHANRQQALIEELEEKNLPIPIDFEERRVEKLRDAEIRLTAEKTSDGTLVRTDLESTIARLKAVGDINEIRILHSQMPLMKDASDADIQRFNERVNALRSWKEFCTGEFDVRQFDDTKGSWEALKKRCNTLEQWEDQYGFKTIRDVVTGSGY